MEILLTIAYFSLVWLIFYKFQLLRFNLFMKFVVFGIYAAAALTEVILLGQTTPYSKELMVERYVIPLAPEYGGQVTEVHVKPNVPIEKGDPIFSMDSVPWQNRVDQARAGLGSAKNDKKSLQAQMVEADRQLQDAVKLVPRKLMAAEQLVIRQAHVDSLTAQIASVDSKLEGLVTEVDEAEYNLEHATVVAPANGYVVNLILRPGAFIRIKQPVVTFVSTDEMFLLASVDQRAAQWIRSGDEALFALSMYPGRVFRAEVDQVVWATGRSQLQLGGVLPREETIKPSEIFFIKLNPVGDFTDTPLEFGAGGLTAIFTRKSIDLVQVIRKIEIQSESLLNYIYNPF